ncbi:MAG: ABC transporter permease [Actinomycetota bacterium]
MSRRGPREPVARGGEGRPEPSEVPPAVAVVGLAGLAIFVVPLFGLLGAVPWTGLLRELVTPEVGTALWLSLVSSFSATAVALVLGVPLAWLQARGSFPGRRLLRTFTAFPLVLPPVVGGVALLLAFGRRGLVGRLLESALGLRLPFSLAGVVLAQTFVAMPFLVLAVEGGFRTVDRRLEEAAQTLGASRWTRFTRVTLPLLRPSLAAGALLCWARALGEFGATITFAGNIPGTTQTMPLAVYLALESRPEAAIVLSIVMLVLSGLVIVGLRESWLGLRP